MIQCDSCEHWRSFTDSEGKEHHFCKVLGARSTLKWKLSRCSDFRLKESQTSLEVLLDA